MKAGHLNIADPNDNPHSGSALGGRTHVRDHRHRVLLTHTKDTGASVTTQQAPRRGVQNLLSHRRGGAAMSKIADRLASKMRRLLGIDADGEGMHGRDLSGVPKLARKNAQHPRQSATRAARTGGAHSIGMALVTALALAAAKQQSGGANSSPYKAASRRMPRI